MRTVYTLLLQLLANLSGMKTIRVIKIKSIVSITTEHPKHLSNKNYVTHFTPANRLCQEKKQHKMVYLFIYFHIFPQFLQNHKLKQKSSGKPTP